MNSNDSIKGRFPQDGIFRAERNFSLSCDFSGGTNEKTKRNSAPSGKFRLVENGLYCSKLAIDFPGQIIKVIYIFYGVFKTVAH